MPVYVWEVGKVAPSLSSDIKTMKKEQKTIVKQAVKTPTFDEVFNQTLKAAQVNYTESNSVGTLSLDQLNSKVNILSRSILNEFNSVLDLLSKRDICVLIIKSAKKNQFIAGANINEIYGVESADEAKKLLVHGHEIFHKIENLPFPTIAVINGPCLGGGLELALACTYRVALIHDSVSIALPEVNLGILPGLGGTQRLSRLIGLSKAVSLIVSGKGVNAKKAYSLGIVDALFHAAFLETRLETFIASLSSSKQRKMIEKRRKKSSMPMKVLESNGVGRWMLHQLVKRQILKKTKGHYPAPMTALNVTIKGYSKPLKKGIDLEIAGFCKLVTTSEAKHLMHIFLTQEFVKKQTQNHVVPTQDTIKQATVLGAGLMGAAIAWLFSYRNIKVRLKDINWGAVLHGQKSIQNIYNQLVKKRRLKKDQADMKLMQTVSLAQDFSGLHQSDIVVEAIVENLTIKQTVFKDLEKHVSRECILASNTSSLSIEKIASSLTYPDRFLGLHFFSPANIMPLVEIIPSKTCKKEVISKAIQVVKKMKKTPIVVKECPGFLVNRILIPYVVEAIRCVEEGEKISRIDRIITQFGMPIGPLALCDQVGLDVGFNVAKVLEDGYGPRMAIPTIMKKMQELDNCLGKKTNRGLYCYKGKQKSENKDINQFCSSPSKKTEKEIKDRLLLIMVNEALMCLDENIVSSPEELDMAMIYGIGFPPFLGGLLMYAQNRGFNDILEVLTQLAQQHGSRFEPCNKLKELVKHNQNLFHSIKEEKHG